LYIDDAGNVTVQPSWRGNYVTVCNVNQAYGSVSQTTCLS
jgi:hypothetical protein